MIFVDPKRIVAQLDVDPGMIAVDLGTGTGHYALALAGQVGVTGSVIAVDIQKDLLKELMSRATDQSLPNIIPLVADIEQERGTKLEEETADLVVIANALFQVEDSYAFLKEAARILKLGGKLLVVDWRESFGGIGPNEKFIISEDALVETTEELGLKLNKKLEAGEYHYALVFQKIK